MRRRFRHPTVAMVDLTAVLSLVVHLIPMLLVTVRFREVAQLDAAAGMVPAVETADTVALADQAERIVSVRITAEGFVVGGAGAVDPILPCEGACAVDTWPYASLTRAMVVARAVHPTERRVVIVAAPTVPYDVVVRTMDATRARRVGDGEEILFSEPLLAVAPE